MIGAVILMQSVLLCVSAVILMQSVLLCCDIDAECLLLLMQSVVRYSVRKLANSITFQLLIYD